MNPRVQLRHPQGKKAVSMEKEKYDLLKTAMVKYMRTHGNVTFAKLAGGIAKDFKTHGTGFEGSLPWHLEWVKLDLEARKVIKRVPKSAPQEYSLGH